MKANLYSLILFIFMTAVLPAGAQPATVMVTSSYYDGYDYHFSSRINRFHRSYTAFNYYAPVFTDVYWYNYQPFSWGLSIYGGGGFGIGYSNYPDYGYYDGWYDPYYGSSYYLGYDPFYYNRWYAPVVVNITRYSNTRSGSTGIYRRESTPVNRTADRQNTGVNRSQDNDRRFSDRNVAERTYNRNDNNNGNNGNNTNGNNGNNTNNGNNGNRYWDDNNPNPNTGNRNGNNNANEGKPGNTNRNTGNTGNKVNNTGNIKGNTGTVSRANNPGPTRSQSPAIRNTSPAISNSGIRSNAGSNPQTNVQKSSAARSGSSVSQGRISTSSRSSSAKASSSSRSSSTKASTSSRSSSSTSRSSKSR